MKTKELSLISALGLSALLAFQTASAADRGLTQTLTIDGDIVGSGCTVSFPTSITFPETDISKLVSSSAATYSNMVMPSGTMPTIALSDCAAAQQFTVTLVGTADSDDASVLHNDATETPAEHVGMMMFLGSGEEELLKPGVASKPYTVNGDGEAGLSAWPGLVKTTDAPAAGDVHISGQIRIDYL
ncbi:fimbrial protein [Enterobacter sp. 22452]|uniref:fimbrial protein n=1 Tax=Enterobacter TaxID=547 RepID=UPI003F86975F